MVLVFSIHPSDRLDKYCHYCLRILSVHKNLCLLTGHLFISRLFPSAADLAAIGAIPAFVGGRMPARCGKPFSWADLRFGPRTFNGTHQIDLKTRTDGRKPAGLLDYRHKQLKSLDILNLVQRRAKGAYLVVFNYHSRRVHCRQRYGNVRKWPHTCHDPRPDFVFPIEENEKRADNQAVAQN